MNVLQIFKSAPRSQHNRSYVVINIRPYYQQLYFLFALLLYKTKFTEQRISHTLFIYFFPNSFVRNDTRLLSESKTQQYTQFYQNIAPTILFLAVFIQCAYLESLF